MTDEPELFGEDEDAPSPFRGDRADAMREKVGGPGRPKGARNRKSVDAERWYFAKGYVDPLQKLGELISEDPRVLVAWFDEHAGEGSDGKKRSGPSILDVVRMQIAAAGELMPYLHGKKPTVIDIPDERLPMLLMMLGTNQLDQAKVIEAQNRMSIGAPLDGEEARISGVSEDDE